MSFLQERFNYLFKSTKGLILVAIAMIGLETALFGMLSGPMAEFGVREFVVRALNMDLVPAEREGRIIILYHSIAMAVVAIETYMITSLLKMKEIYRTAVRALVTCGYLMAMIFGMDIIGNVFLAFLTFFLTGLCSIGIGMIIGAISKTNNHAEPLCWLFSMPLAMLSGCWFSIDMMPSYLRTIASAFPYIHTIEAARGVTTGISAADRATTVLAAVAPDAQPQDLVQPGHIFPLMAQPGGVLVRAGHTEAGCDLARAKRPTSR